VDYREIHRATTHRLLDAGGRSFTIVHPQASGSSHRDRAFNLATFQERRTFLICVMSRPGSISVPVVAFRRTFIQLRSADSEKGDTRPCNCSELRHPAWNQISLPVRNVCENHCPTYALPHRVWQAKLTNRALFRVYGETTNNHCAHLSTVGLFLNSHNWEK
jgi:hypothetical protein